MWTNLRHVFYVDVLGVYRLTCLKKPGFVNAQGTQTHNTPLEAKL